MKNQEIENFCKGSGLKTFVVVHDDDMYDPETYSVTVDGSEYDIALCLNFYSVFPDASINVRKRVPPFVNAEVGNIVEVFTAYSLESDPPTLGIVTSKIQKPDGSFIYGCSYILMKDQTNHNIYPISLSHETYGNYHKGFVRILSQEEAEVELNKANDKQLKSDLEAAEALHKKRQTAIAEIRKVLSELQPLSVTKLFKGTEFYTSIQLPGDLGDTSLVRNDN